MLYASLTFKSVSQSITLTKTPIFEGHGEVRINLVYKVFFSSALCEGEIPKISCRIDKAGIK